MRYLAVTGPINGPTSPALLHAECWGIKHILLLMLHQMKALWYVPGAMGWWIIIVFFPSTIDDMILKLYHLDFCSTH